MLKAMEAKGELVAQQKSPTSPNAPHRPAKTALIPLMMRTFRSSFFNLESLFSRETAEPPNCSAAPSRPAEPPNRWVAAVARKITGAIKGLIFSPFSTASII